MRIACSGSRNLRPRLRTESIAYGASVVIHALWNGLVILLSQRAATFGPDPTAALRQSPAQAVFVIAMATALVLASALGLVGIVYVVQSAKSSLQTSHLNEESSV